MLYEICLFHFLSFLNQLWDMIYIQHIALILSIQWWVLNNVYTHVTTTTIKIMNNSITPDSSPVPLWSQFPTPPHPWPHWAAFCSYRLDLSFLEYLQWNCIVSIPLFLASFTPHNVFEIHQCCLYKQFVSSYWWVLFHCMDRPQFSQSPNADGYLCCFQFRFIISKAAM